MNFNLFIRFFSISSTHSACTTSQCVCEEPEDAVHLPWWGLCRGDLPVWILWSWEHPCATVSADRIPPCLVDTLNLSYESYDRFLHTHMIYCNKGHFYKHWKLTLSKSVIALFKMQSWNHAGHIFHLQTFMTFNQYLKSSLILGWSWCEHHVKSLVITETANNGGCSKDLSWKSIQQQSYHL